MVILLSELLADAKGTEEYEVITDQGVTSIYYTFVTDKGAIFSTIQPSIDACRFLRNDFLDQLKSRS